MKKVITIALALLFVISAVSSFAIVQGSDIDGKKVWFDSLSISTDKAMADYAIVGTSAIADPASTYVGDQMIFGYLKFGFDNARPEQNDKNINVHIVSDYATFPLWLNQGYSLVAGGSTTDLIGPARAHFVDKNGILNVFPVNPDYVPTTFNPFTIKALTKDEEFQVTFNLSDVEVGAAGVPVATGYLFDAAGATTIYSTYKYFVDTLNTNPSPLAKVNGKHQTSMYVGFNGIVKASASTQGVIKAYVTSGDSDKFVVKQIVEQAGLFGTHVNYNNVATYDNAAPYIDKYKDGKKVYRVYKLYGTGANNPFAGAVPGYSDEDAGPPALDSTEDYQAYEYLVQPFKDDDTLESWAVGFQNASYQTNVDTFAKRFGKFTYREGLETSEKAKVLFPTANEPTVAGTLLTTSVYDAAYTRNTALVGTLTDGIIEALVTKDLPINQLYTNGAMKLKASDSDKYYKFFKVVEGGADLDVQLKEANQLDSKVDPIMEFFGFSYDYINATNDSHYVSGGWKTYKEATFNYFGASVAIDDDDVIPAETGDASTTIVIVLAASALLAAAALFFVMKKARD